MNIINTCDTIKSVFSDGFNLQAWRRYASKISVSLPAKCEADAKKYDFEKNVLPILNNALQADKIDLVNDSFQSVTDI